MINKSYLLKKNEISQVCNNEVNGIRILYDLNNIYIYKRTNTPYTLPKKIMVFWKKYYFIQKNHK